MHALSQCEGHNAIRSVVVMFEVPSHRHCFSEVLGDQCGSCTDLLINGRRLYCEESPAFTQPDLLVNRGTGDAVGLTFELAKSAQLFSRWQELLHNLDPDCIRLTVKERASTGEPSDCSLEVIWGDVKESEQVFAQLDYGLWAFLYPTPTPKLTLDADSWTVPEGLVIADLRCIRRPVSVSCSNSAETEIQPRPA
jgi:hypothetical protein